MNTKDITEAWATVRLQNNSIPDDVLDFMKNSAIAALSSTPAGEDVTKLAEDLLVKHSLKRNHGLTEIQIRSMITQSGKETPAIKAMIEMHGEGYKAALQNKVPVECYGLRWDLIESFIIDCLNEKYPSATNIIGGLKHLTTLPNTTIK